MNAAILWHLRTAFAWRVYEHGYCVPSFIGACQAAFQRTLYDAVHCTMRRRPTRRVIVMTRIRHNAINKSLHRVIGVFTRITSDSVIIEKQLRAVSLKLYKPTIYNGES